VISKNILISVDVNKLSREKWKVDRGYSSGASSYASDHDDENNENSNHHHHNSNDKDVNGTPKVVVELPFDPKKIPRPKMSLHRNTSEVSCLSELKETIEKDGDLAKTIVRMEVRHVNENSFLVCFRFVMFFPLLFPNSGILLYEFSFHF
jgi:hypothetical protein